MDKSMQIMTHHHETATAIRAAMPEAGKKTSAPFMWFGGKGIMQAKMIKLLPAGHTYVEPYAGAASIFWASHERYNVHVLNDLNTEIINLYRVLQSPETFDAFADRVTFTPYSLDEFRRALAYAGDDPVMRAWSFFVRQNQGFSGMAGGEGNWSKNFRPRRGMAGTSSNWRSRIKLLDHWHGVLGKVQLDNRCALQVIRYWDRPDTVFYIDPPYVMSTRKSGGYDHEVTDQHHADLVELLLTVQGAVVLSGYDSPAYAPLTDAGWSRVDFQTACHAAGHTRGSGIIGKGSAKAKVGRTEVVWINRPTQGILL